MKYRYLIFFALCFLSFIFLSQTNFDLSLLKLNFHNKEKHILYSSKELNIDSFAESIIIYSLENKRCWKILFEFLFGVFKKSEEFPYIEESDLVNKYERLGFIEAKYDDFIQLTKDYFYEFLDVNKDRKIDSWEWNRQIENERVFLLSFINLAKSSDLEKIINNEQNLNNHKTKHSDKNHKENKIEKTNDNINIFNNILHKSNTEDFLFLSEKFQENIYNNPPIKNYFIENLIRFFDANEDGFVERTEIITILNEIQTKYFINLKKIFEDYIMREIQLFFNLLDVNNDAKINIENEVNNLGDIEKTKLLDIVFNEK